MQRAARADERAGELQVCARVNEEPAVLVPEPQRPELVVAPTDDALILGGQLVGEGWELGCGHNCSNEQIRAQFVGRSLEVVANALLPPAWRPV